MFFLNFCILVFVALALGVILTIYSNNQTRKENLEFEERLQKLLDYSVRTREIEFEKQIEFEERIQKLLLDHSVRIREIAQEHENYLKNLHLPHAEKEEKP